ncbi:putative alcohol dehydrogenase [Xylariomycetidae sp. FL2044]|nr:putative alcohol dehydrogenase [Xylariomycetidae sp. FL2044]
MLPKEQTALIVRPGGDTGKANSELPLAVSHSVPVPILTSPHHVLVRVLAVALNPNDHKMILHFSMSGNTAGCDFCGIIIQSSSSADDQYHHHPVGTRVCGAAFPYKPGDTGGSFAQYIAVDSRLLVAVPCQWSDLQGAALGGVGWSTLSMAFSDAEALGLSGMPTKPTEKHQPVLVYGGATATGTLACQLLKLSGYDAVAVTSASSRLLALKNGAVGVACYDVPSPPCVDQIRSAIGDRPIRYALDCITDADSADICFRALARTGGRYACLEQFSDGWRSRQAVKVKEVMGFEVLGVDVDLGPGTTYTRTASSRLHAIGMVWAKEIEHLLKSDLIQTHPIAEVKIEGQEWWDGVIQGLDQLRRGEVRGLWQDHAQIATVQGRPQFMHSDSGVLYLLILPLPARPTPLYSLPEA